MNRITVIQYFIDKYKHERYLEIGVHKGYTFLPIRCRKKLGVDPYFQIDYSTKIKWLLKLPLNFFNSYFEITSDVFFKEKVTGTIDAVFIDGLHTFEGSLNDALNSLKFLSEDGTIILHDCFPPDKGAATPAISYQEIEKSKPEGWTGLWCGDVWKTIVYLKEKYSKELEVIVLDTDFGLGIVKFKTSKREFNLKIDNDLFQRINNIGYDELMADPGGLIGLKDKNFLFKSF